MTYSPGCWGWHAQAVGRQHPFDLYYCDGCHKKIAKKHNVHHFEYRILCTPCATARHISCPMELTGSSLSD